MRLAILSRGPHLYSTRRLHEAAIGCGHHVHVLDTLAFSVVVDRERSALLYGDGKARLPSYAAVIPRIGASVTQFGSAVVAQFESMGVRALNGAQSIRNSRDKMRASQILAAADLPTPTTVLIRASHQVRAAFAAVGGPPAVIKVIEGTQGVGVFLVDDLTLAESLVETLQSAGQRFLVQKFIAESRGRDIRALVVGGEVVAAMRRIAKPGEFRSNLHRGARVESARLDSKTQEVAIAAAAAFDLDVAGVDMLEGKRGPTVLEVNSSPGLEGIEAATGVDVASHIVDLVSRGQDDE